MRMGRNVDLIPTTAYLQKDGSFLFGEDADDMSVIDPGNYSRGFKMRLGGKAPELGRYTAQDLVREYLAHILQKVEADATMFGIKVDGAVLTCPVNFSKAQIHQLREAALAAGLPQVEFVTEPEAAGSAFCFSCAAEAFRKNALVVDWGGGTLDVALITRQGKSLRSNRRYAFGLNTVGGEAFDDCLCNYVLGELASRMDESRLSMPELMKNVRSLKVSLSAGAEGVLRMVPDGSPLALKVKRTEFEKLIAEDVTSAAAEVKAFMEGLPADCKPEMLVLVGGTALIPCIRRTLEAVTGLPARTWAKAREAVVMGAALLAIAEDTATEEEHSTPLPQDSQKLLALANSGNKRAQYEAGLQSLNAHNEAEAFMWFTKAASRDYLPAMFRLGLCYEEGIGTAKNAQKALGLYQRAADAGSSEALYRLGMAAEKGTLLSLDSGRAVRYYQKAAGKDHPYGMWALGRCYAEGIGIDADSGQAYRWLRRAADKGVTDAQYRIAKMYENGIAVVKSSAEAMAWYKTAADNEHPEALYELFLHTAKSPLSLCYRASVAGCKRAKLRMFWYVAKMLLLLLVLLALVLTYMIYNGHVLLGVLIGLVYLCGLIMFARYCGRRHTNFTKSIFIGMGGIFLGAFMFMLLFAKYPDMASNEWLVSSWNGEVFTSSRVTSELESRIMHGTLNGADLQMLVQKGYRCDNSFIAKLVEKHDAEAVRILVTAPGAKYELVNSASQSLLRVAIENNDVPMVEALLQHPHINVHATQNGGASHLEYARRRGYTECVRLLEAAMRRARY